MGVREHDFEDIKELSFQAKENQKTKYEDMVRNLSAVSLPNLCFRYIINSSDMVHATWMQMDIHMHMLG